MKKTGEILFISYLAMIITENTMKDHSKVSKHKSASISKLQC